MSILWSRRADKKVRFLIGRLGSGKCTCRPHMHRLSARQPVLFEISSFLVIRSYWSPSPALGSTTKISLHAPGGLPQA
jgi:hypothetical protein